jgi:hypothetical protein
MPFDFSAFSHNPPPLCKVLAANSELRIRTPTGTVFIVRKPGLKYELYAITEVSGKEQFLMMRDELGPLLSLLGYRTREPIKEPFI